MCNFSSVGIVTLLVIVQQNNLGSIPSRYKRGTKTENNFDVTSSCGKYIMEHANTEMAQNGVARDTHAYLH